MKKQNYYRFALALLLFQIIFVSSGKAQNSGETKAEIGVAGIEIGNRESAEKFLKEGYSPRLEEDGRVAYYFYNKWGTQVMKLTANSLEDRYFITEIEVFRVSPKYRKNHFQAEDIKYFATECGIFIGFKQSAAFLIAGLENTGKINKFKPKNIISLKGEPAERTTEDKKSETLSYKIMNVKLADSTESLNYEETYEFYKDELKRFTLKIVMEQPKLAVNK